MAATHYEGLTNALIPLVIRGLVNTDTAFLSTIRALPASSDLLPETSPGSSGLRGFLKYPAAIVTPVVESDISTYLDDLPIKFHGALNLITAAALIGFPKQVLAVLRGPDPQREGRLFASIITDERFGATTGIRVGTHHHLETFSVEGFPDSSDLLNMALLDVSGTHFWKSKVLPVLFPTAAALSDEKVAALGTCLTGFTVTDSGRLEWLFPVTTDDLMINRTPTLRILDFGATRPKKWTPKDLDKLLKKFDNIMDLVTAGDMTTILDRLSSDFAPLVKDLVRWASHSHPDLGRRDVYIRVWASNSFRAKDAYYGALSTDFPFNVL